MNRDEMIEKLVSYSVETALRNPQAEWTRRILVKGFDGFHRMPPKKLERELQLRGLISYDETRRCLRRLRRMRRERSDGAAGRYGRPEVLHG